MRITHRITGVPGPGEKSLSDADVQAFLDMLKLHGSGGVVDVHSTNAPRGKITKIWAEVPERDLPPREDFEALAAEARNGHRDSDLLPQLPPGEGATLAGPPAIEGAAVARPQRVKARHRRD